MAKSLVQKFVNQARPSAYKSVIPHSARWNTNAGSLYGSGTQDRFSMLQASGGQGTLYAIVQLISTGQAKSSWSMYRTDPSGHPRYTKSDRGSDMRVEVRKHQALRLWKRPNDFMTGYMFREIGWQFMELVGEWYWVLDRGPTGLGIPTAMWPVRPDRMEPVPDRDKFLSGWVYTGPNGEQVPLLASEVIQLRYPHPTDFYRGQSPVQSLLAHIDSARYTAEWARNFFMNSATPGGIVIFSKRLTDDEFQEFVSRWREQHQGVARGHRVGVLEQGATWNPNTYTLNDMQFVELNRMDRDNIREAYRIHQAMLGNSEDVNRANAQTAEEVHVAWHEITRLERTRDILNEFFLPTFGPTSEQREFDFLDPAPASANEINDELIAKSTAAKMLVDAGWHPKDVLEVVGLPGMTWIGPAVVGTPQLPANPTLGPTEKLGEPGLHEDDPDVQFNDADIESVRSIIRRSLRPFELRGGHELTDDEAVMAAHEIRAVFGKGSNGHVKELV